MRPETPIVGWLFVIIGLTGLVLSATAVWGLVGSDWAYVRRVRSRYVWRLLPQRRGRALGGLPFFSVLALCFGLWFAVPEARGSLILWLVGVASMLASLLVARWPGKLMPVWLREA